MGKRRSDNKIGKKSKRQKPNSVDVNEISVAVNAQKGELAPPISKLNAICCDDLFEWLSIEDLHSLGQTCERMHRLTGLYFQGVSKNADIICEDQSIFYKYNNINGFIPYINSVKFDFDAKMKDFQFIRSIKCDSLRKISFDCDKLSKYMINCMKKKNWIKSKRLNFLRRHHRR